MNDIKSLYSGKITSEHPSQGITSITSSDIESQTDLNVRSEFKDRDEERAAFLATAKRNAGIMFTKYL